jgi:hypothetical protein
MGDTDIRLGIEEAVDPRPRSQPDIRTGETERFLTDSSRSAKRDHSLRTRPYVLCHVLFQRTRQF